MSGDSGWCLSEVRNPYTGSSWLVVLFSTVGTVLAIAPHSFCDFAYLNSVPNNFYPEGIRLSLGLFKYEGIEDDGGDNCYDYPSEVEVDGLWTAARAFAILGCVLSGISCAFFWFSGLSHSTDQKDKKRWMFLGIGSLLGALFCGLSFLFFNSSACNSSNWSSSDGCELGTGGKYIVAGTVCLGVTGIGTFVIDPPLRLTQHFIPPVQELVSSTPSAS